jgi:hypothetical protein
MLEIVSFFYLLLTQILHKMNNSNLKSTNQIVKNTSDKVCVGVKELTLTDAAQSLSFASLLNGSVQADIGSVAIKVKSAGSPTDSTHLVRFTQVSGETPTVSHGMWFGSGDYFEITGNANVSAAKFIAAEVGIASILTIEYYGK